MPAKVETPPALPGLSPVGGKPVIARFDGRHLSSDGGLLVLREIEQRLEVAGRLAACLTDPRDPDWVVHGLDEIICFRLLMIAAGYEVVAEVRRQTPKVGAVCGSPARTVLCGGTGVTRFPTAIN